MSNTLIVAALVGVGSAQPAAMPMTTGVPPPQFRGLENDPLTGVPIMSATYTASPAMAMGGGGMARGAMPMMSSGMMGGAVMSSST